MIRFLLACLLALAPCAHAEHAHAKPNVPRPDLGASGVFDPQGTLWIVYKEGQHVMLRGSTDAGVSWMSPRVVNAAEEAIEAGGDSSPKIAAGRKGELFVTWTRPSAKFHTGQVRFARSLDGGKAFGAPVTVNIDRQDITHRFDSVAVNRDGKVFVAWIDSREGATSLYFSVSSDGGATFPKDQRAGPRSCECCRVSQVVQEDGSVLAMWRAVFDPNIRDHAIARLGADGGVSEARRATFDDWRVDACPHHGPSLAQDGAKRLHAVWFSGTPGKEGVYYGRLREGSVEGQRRVGGDTAEHADIAASGKRIAIAWKEFDGKRSRLRAMRSDDGGETWTEVDLASTEGASDHPKVLARGASFYVLWNTRDQPLQVVPLS
jgi:hypothetical protein